MPLKIALTIGDEDLKHFRAQMRRARSAAKEAGEYETELTRSLDAELKEKMEAQGVIFMEIDRAQMAKTVRPVLDSWTKVFGADLLEKVDKFKAQNK